MNPLDYALKHNRMDMDLVLENKDFHRILKLCLEIDYKKRATAEYLFNDPFFEPYTTE